MLDKSQENLKITGDHNKMFTGDDNSKIENHYYGTTTRLSLLFDKLNDAFNDDSQITIIIDDLNRYMIKQDQIGLDEKLINGNKAHLIMRAKWLKQEYFKKLSRFQFFEPAQQIHSFILGVVLEKFMNIINPMLSQNAPDAEVMEAISTKIITPILAIIEIDGRNDIMGLSSTEIQGMIYYLTGRCHISWEA